MGARASKAISKKKASKPRGGNPVAVLLERIEEQNRATYEALTSFRRELIQKVDDLEERLTRRIEALEFAVRKNSEDIRKNSQDIQTLFAAVAELSAKLEAKPTHEELVRLEARVAVLEERVGISTADT